MLYSFGVQISMTCSGCNLRLPVNGIVPSVRCYHCAADVKPNWDGYLREHVWREALGWPEGKTDETIAILTGGRIRFGRVDPRCACGTPLTAADVHAGITRGGHICACGRTTAVRAADALCRSIYPALIAAIDESALDAEATAIQARTTPVLFACMGCGGTLRVDGTSRTVACDHCEAPNFLPDGLWQQLRPVPTVRPFFLIAKFDQATLRYAMMDDDQRVVARADEPGLTVEEYAALARSDRTEVAVRVARNPAVPEQLFLRLAEHEDKQVRAGVALNPRAPHAIIQRLAGDPAPLVLLALLTRDDLYYELVDGFARHPEPDVRIAAANHRALPFPALHRLARDDEFAEVRAAAEARLATLRAQGFPVSEPPPKPGLLARLFS